MTLAFVSGALKSEYVLKILCLTEPCVAKASVMSVGARTEDL